ncbi:hypothetical protein [Marinicrinis lubricantis]|uniref:BIG2 domain-containing protein n=1 Tax=Marinicrinis lubricantis TaxID=2086470 RepID=A0ABW1ISU3_9BACL
MIHQKYKSKMIAWLLAALLVGIIPLPAAAEGAESSSVSDFSVTSDVYAGPYFSGYYDYPDSLPVYHFSFTPASSLQAGDTIEVHVPEGYSYEGMGYYVWTPADINPDSIEITVNGTERPGLISRAGAIQDAVHQSNAIQFTLSDSIQAGASVDMELSQFLKNPDYHHETAGPRPFALHTSKDTVPYTASFDFFSRRVTDYYPDADSYTVSAVSGYQFKFTVMQPIETNTPITITFPDGIQLPDAIDPQHVQINSMPAASVQRSDNQLNVMSPVRLNSFQSVIIAISPEAQITNPAETGYYEFRIQPATDSLAAVRTIGFIPVEGSSLNSNDGFISLEQDGSLRFRSYVHTILKGGDTVTVASPEGMMITEGDIVPEDIVIESSGMDELLPPFTPSSVERLSDNQLRFTLPEGFHLDPDYGFAFRIPNPFGQSFGIYAFEVSTSVETIPAPFTFEYGPERIEHFTVVPESRLPGEGPTAYTFELTAHHSLRTDYGQYISLQLPDEMALPESIEHGTVTVNGIAAEIYISHDEHAIQVYVPVDIPLLGQVTIQVNENAGLYNPASEGTYSFAVWMDYLQSENMATTTQVQYGTNLPEPVEEWVELYFELEHLELNLAQKHMLVLYGEQSDGSVHRIGLEEVTFTTSTPHVANMSGDGTITAGKPGTTIVTAAYGNLQAELQIYVSPYLNIETLLLIDMQQDGLHIEDVIRYLRTEDDFDLNGDGLFGEDDVKLLLFTLDPVYFPPYNHTL